MTPDTITAIASVLAGAASFGLALALRALARERRHANAYRQAARDSHTVAERWRAEAMSLRKPARDGSDGSLGSLGRALRKAATPPSSSRSFPTARGTRPTDTTDATAAAMLGVTTYTGSGSYDGNSYTPSCDTSSSSSSSSDGGSCGGGE